LFQKKCLKGKNLSEITADLEEDEADNKVLKMEACRFFIFTRLEKNTEE